MLKLMTPAHWEEYELIDFGRFEKLERFGRTILIRPEPQAVGDSILSESEWHKKADFRFEQKNSSTGTWIPLKKNVPDRWKITYKSPSLQLQFRLGMTAFKHVGLFPEQAVNWEYIAERGKQAKGMKILNLFAYTGGASLAGAACGAEVTHVDSVKQVITWANENREISQLRDIRWIVEDALKFVQREERRGNKYHGIILDPPAYGIGANGERWKLEEKINELIASLSKLLEKKNSFLIFNAYSMGFSPLIPEALIQTHFKDFNLSHLECGELYFPDQFGRKLPMGVFARFHT
jgi:23S rRNA (cytosine1962-C5)-methyltransferase